MLSRPHAVLYVSFNQSSYRTDEGTSFAAAVITSMCYEGDFDVAINTMDVSATGEGQSFIGCHNNSVDCVPCSTAQSSFM